MAAENNKAEQTRLTSSPAAFSQNSGVSRPAVGPIQKMPVKPGNQENNPNLVPDSAALENKAFHLPVQRRNDQPATIDIEPFQLMRNNRNGQPSMQYAAPVPIVQRMVPEGLEWYTLVRVNTGESEGKIARILLPYTNPANTKEKGYFVSFVDGGFQRSYLYHQLDPLGTKEEGTQEEGTQEVSKLSAQGIGELNPKEASELKADKEDELDTHWTKELSRFSGGPALRVATWLREIYSGTENELYDGTSFNGIEKAIKEKDLTEYTSLEELLIRAEQLTEWRGKNGGALDDWLKKRLSMKEVSYVELRQLTEEVAEVVRENWDAPMAIADAGLWTDGMGPCITVAMTATSGGKRYNALLHSMDLSAKGATVVNAIERLFNKSSPPLVPFAKLENINFFVAGGDSSTAEKAESILEELAARRLPVVSTAITSANEEAALTKAFLITSEGKVAYSMYNAKEFHRD